MTLHGLVPSFDIHVSVSDLYNYSNQKQGRAVVFLGILKPDLVCRWEQGQEKKKTKLFYYPWNWLPFQPLYQLKIWRRELREVTTNAVLADRQIVGRLEQVSTALKKIGLLYFYWSMAQSVKGTGLRDDFKMLDKKRTVLDLNKRHCRFIFIF